MASKCTIEEASRAVDTACSGTGYSCKYVSWDDAERGTVGGDLSCWGGNITDTYLYEKNGKKLFTVRSDNWNEKLGQVSTSDVALVTGNHLPGEQQLTPTTLKSFLQSFGQFASYAGADDSTNLSDAVLDEKVSIRFQTTFLPVDEDELASLEFCTEAYNYNTMSDADPRNAVVLCTTQGVAVQQDGCGAKRLYHHSVDPQGVIHRYWLEAERSRHKVGGAQAETQQEALEAAARGKATAAVIGTRAMGTRFNALMTVQVPLKQKPKPRPRPQKLQKFSKSSGLLGSWSLLGGVSLGSTCASYELEMDSVEDCMDDCMDAGFGGGWEDEEEIFDECALMCEAPMEASMEAACLSSASMPGRRLSERSRAEQRRGTANAARVSRGSEVDTWPGLAVAKPERDPHQRLTVTVVLYNTVAGGVPSPEDVAAAIEDMESLYAACGWSGHLADEGAGFMKSELTVDTATKIAQKKVLQPYTPPVGVAGLVQNGAVFPE